MLHPDRFFDPDPSVRRVARALYESVRGLPLVCPHGHVEPSLLAEDEPFPEPTALLIVPDHYLFRMLYSQGVPMERLGVPTRDGAEVETDPRAIWQTFAEHYHLFAATPSRAWLDHTFAELFEIAPGPSGLMLDADNAQHAYDQIAERLESPEYRPRALYERFGIEVLCTTDAATDDLRHHEALRDDPAWSGDMRPTFRPDALFRIASAGWPGELAALESATDLSIGTYAGFREALVQRRAYFQKRGATATDHAVVEPLTRALPDAEVEALFQRARTGVASPEDQADFEAHMLVEMAAMSAEDGLVMQIHPGSYRDHHTAVAERFGPDKGADIPVATEYTCNLHALLNAYGAHPNVRIVLFTLDESTYARELAPLAGHYPALRLGPAWWFHDSLNGIARFFDQVMETAGLYNTAGFNDDTRAFCSIPARHDLSRRVDCNWLADKVATHEISHAEAERLARLLAYDLAKETYRL
jgi:glucuronate isomerase